MSDSTDSEWYEISELIKLLGDANVSREQKAASAGRVWTLIYPFVVRCTAQVLRDSNSLDVAHDTLVHIVKTVMATLVMDANTGKVENVPGYLRGVIKHRVQDYLRRSATRRRIDHTYFELHNHNGHRPPPDTSFVMASDNEERDALQKAVNALEPLYREPITLYYFANHTLTEIAAVLDIPPGTVKSRLHKARLKLRDDLLRRGIDE